MADTTANLSPKLLKMLCEQIAHESYNSHLYLKMSSALKINGLDKLGAHFDGQFSEENGHQKLVADFISDRNEPAQIMAVPAVDVDPSGILEIAQLYVKQEKLTTAKLKAIAKAAWDEFDLIAFDFLSEMIDKQRVEEEEAMTFADQAALTKGEPSAVLFWNNTYAG